MFKSFKYGKILCVALLLLILANAALYMIVSYGLYNSKPYKWVQALNKDTDVYDEEGEAATEFFKNKKLHVYGFNVINLVSALVVVALVYVG